MIKRCFDLLLTTIGIIVLMPFFVLVAIWVYLDSPGNVIYKQLRVGRLGKLFFVFKFRTMIIDADKKGLLITVSNDSRITRSGQFLRKYKLDELPQLFNVLFGDMSLVGPRPEVKEYMDMYPEAIRQKVLSVRPGITDIASIYFRNENEMLDAAIDPRQTYIDTILPIKQKCYIEYVDNRSAWLDIKLIFLTVYKIVF